MQLFKESLIYRFTYWLYVCYQNSCLHKVLSALTEICRHSFPGRWIRSTMAHESFFRHSVVFGMMKAVFKVLDNWMISLSKALGNWSETSLIVNASKLLVKASKEKLFALAFPVFGIGYLAGRVLFNKLMIRDVFLLGLLFIFAGIVLIDRKKRKAIWVNSFAYQLYIILLE
ncbi:MAG: hypothetical protein GX144_00565 [Clostridiaceae bacterium]|nr:hypothetical protein [Clostridiaceae bacterium]